MDLVGVKKKSLSLDFYFRIRDLCPNLVKSARDKKAGMRTGDPGR